MADKPVIIGGTKKKVLVVCEESCELSSFLLSFPCCLEFTHITKIDQTLQNKIWNFDPDVVLIHLSPSQARDWKTILGQIASTVSVPLVALFPPGERAEKFSSLLEYVTLLTQIPELHRDKIAFVGRLFCLAYTGEIPSIYTNGRAARPSLLRFMEWTLVIALLFSTLAGTIFYFLTRNVSEVPTVIGTVFTSIVLLLTGKPARRYVQQWRRARNRPSS